MTELESDLAEKHFVAGYERRRWTALARDHWPTLCTVVVLLSIVLWFITAIRKDEAGHIVYVLDDPYIHMALAKNFALHHVWGITRYEFSSSTSSPLWTLLLSGIYLLTGPSESVPLALNIAFAIILTVIASIILVRIGLTATERLVTLTLLVFLTPLPWLIFTGMEHTLHALLTVSFASLAGSIYANPAGSRARIRWLCLLAALIPITRYEGLLIVAVVGSLFAVRGKLRLAIAVWTSAAVPVVLYGAISVANGWLPLPNSVLIKAAKGGTNPNQYFYQVVLTKLIHVLSTPQVLCFLLLVALTMGYRFIRRSVLGRVEAFLGATFIGTVSLHMALSPFWMDLGDIRYDGYLVALGVVASAVSWRGWRLARRTDDKSEKDRLSKFATAIVAVPSTVICASTLVLAIQYPAVASLQLLRGASGNIFEQQYQMGLFLTQLPPGTAIAANDIGAINYLADIRCLDIVGLGNVDVARMRFAHRYGPKELESLANARHVQLAVVYDTWLLVNSDNCYVMASAHPWIGVKEGVPSTWRRIGGWVVAKNVVLGNRVVSFYSVDKSARHTLGLALEQFDSSLPPTVVTAKRMDSARRRANP